MNQKKATNEDFCNKKDKKGFRYLQKAIFGRQGNPDALNKYRMELHQYSSFKDLGIPGIKSASDLKHLSHINRLQLPILLAHLKEWFQEFDSCYLLGIYVFYGFMAQEKRKRKTYAIETNADFSTEILQAIALTDDNKGVIEPLFRRRKDFMKEVDAITYLLMFRNLYKANQQSQNMEDAENVIEAMRSHTTFVRNWTYACHAKKVMTGLLEGIDAETKVEYGMAGSDMARAFAQMTEILVVKLDKHLANLRELYQQKSVKSIIHFFIERYGDVYHSDYVIKEEIAQLRGPFKLLRLRVAFRELADIALIQGFSFSIEEVHQGLEDNNIKALEKFIRSLSYKFGSLKIGNMDQLLLDNPVRKKPFIQLDDNTYFCPLLPSLWDYLPEIIEEDILPSLGKKTQLKYSKIKGSYAEQYVADLLSKYFPKALLFSNITWSKHDKPGKRFEMDHVLMLGSCVLIFEVKSSRLTASAKRGGLGRLKKHIEELVLRPSRQNNRFIEAAQKDLIESIKHQDGRLIDLDFRRVKYYVPIIATFEFASGMQGSRQIFDSGLAKDMQYQEINLRISMTDLASVFEVLPYTAMKIHYLVRRRELESHVILNGIETDFLEFYLHSGFNIGEREYNTICDLVLSDTRNLDLYFTTKESPYAAPMPKPQLTYLWQHLLADLDSKQETESWLEASFALLNCSFSEQKQFEKKMKRFLRKCKFFRKSKPYMLYPAGIKERKILLAAYLHTAGMNKSEQLESLQTEVDRNASHQYVIKLAVCIKKIQSRYSYECIILGDSDLMEDPLKFIEYKL